jgi:REP element-mobilizing transposase RayT
MNNKKYSTCQVGLQISYIVCTKVSKTSHIWEDKTDIGKILRQLCEPKGAEIIEAREVMIL